MKNKTPELELLLHLHNGDELHHTVNKNADGTPQRWRVNGKPADIEWKEEVDLPYVRWEWLADTMQEFLGLPPEAFTKVWKAMPHKRTPIAMRLPVKHGLRNTDQLRLPKDGHLIDWKGWTFILRKRKREAERKQREADRAWAHFRKMWERKPCYWIVAFRKDGWAIIRNGLLVEDSPAKFAWAEVNPYGNMQRQWADYHEMLKHVEANGYERMPR